MERMERKVLTYVIQDNIRFQGLEEELSENDEPVFMEIVIELQGLLFSDTECKREITSWKN